tara:strand:- start:179 stop:322 length:144 start_codon:yes stop_codon:yes gene_type:complete
VVEAVVNQEVIQLQQELLLVVMVDLVVEVVVITLTPQVLEVLETNLL